MSEGNCQLAVQYYFQRIHSLFLPPSDIFPDAHWETRPFLFQDEQSHGDVLRSGDVLYAECIRSKHGQPLHRDRSAFATPFEYLVRLHMAVYIGDAREQISLLAPPADVLEDGHLIWHANYIDGACGIWPLQKFQQYYSIVAARRIVDPALTS